MREWWQKNNFIQIYSPKFMGAPSESGAELFEVGYFGKKAYLAQSPQFYKQMAMASGFGWYSLAGILMGDAFGPVYGGASFMIELLRELVALVLIPLAIRTKPCTAIGYAGATAMDFTLPVIQTTGGVRCVPIAIVSGFILSLLVPVLMLFFVSLAG